MTVMEISRLDTADPTARHRWYDAQERAIRAERPYALLVTQAAFDLVATEPTEYVHREWWEARAGGEVVGTASLELPLAENRDVAWVEINVLAEHRRRGVGRALWLQLADLARAAGRTRLGGEVAVNPDAEAAPRGFAAAMGAVEKHLEHHLVADLPITPARVRQVRLDGGYDLVTWRGRCPDEHRPAYLAMSNQMNADVPSGDLALEVTVLDDERLAMSEERLMRSYEVRVAAARRRSDGVFGGYSLLFHPHGADYAWQDDTLVMPEHRGHRLGAALKCANYADLPDGVGLVHTWTDPTNTAMYRTNAALGFAAVEHLYEVEAAIA